MIQNLDIPTGYHFGLTANTGRHNCDQEIYSMKTFVKKSVEESVAETVEQIRNMAVVGPTPRASTAHFVPHGNENRPSDYFS